jgi:hypothetical protein
MIQEIDRVIDGDHEPDDVARIQAKIKRMRQSGLESRGEFSVENLVFKNLRNGGYLEKLSDAKNKILDNELSL